jgi:hypothetical protein
VSHYADHSGQSPDYKKDGDHIMIYALQAIAGTVDISLQWGGMILIALLSGGNYNKVSSAIIDLFVDCLTALGSGWSSGL